VSYEGDDVGQDRRGGAGDHRLDAAHVVGQPGPDLAGLGVREKESGEGLQVRVQPVAQVPHNLLPPGTNRALLNTAWISSGLMMPIVEVTTMSTMTADTWSR
jgi:hypothetical protein